MVATFLDESGDDEIGVTIDGTQGNTDGACKLRYIHFGLASIHSDHPKSGFIVTTGLRKIFPLLSEVGGYGPKWEEIYENFRILRRVDHTVQR